MMTTTEKTAALLEAHARKDKHFASFTHYNRFYQVVFEIPSHFQKLDTPQWSHIREIKRIDPARFDSPYLVTITVFENEMFHLDFALRHSFLKVTI